MNFNSKLRMVKKENANANLIVTTLGKIGCRHVKTKSGMWSDKLVNSITF